MMIRPTDEAAVNSPLVIVSHMHKHIHINHKPLDVWPRTTRCPPEIRPGLEPGGRHAAYGAYVIRRGYMGDIDCPIRQTSAPPNP